MCSPHKLMKRENWYLNNYHPLFNMLTKSYKDPRTIFKSSPIKNIKISTSLSSITHTHTHTAGDAHRPSITHTPFICHLGDRWVTKVIGGRWWCVIGGRWVKEA
uniref:Uncharacterized protein n=1 Tax=Cantharellus appalachiensis TaxID=409893 RepID=A0A2S0S434_9AGAM|nr:hypothetical protein [Cantharellus appalachiensis]AWA82108.1 hypothetical protein [Cantharellus appalachiensis]